MTISHNVVVIFFYYDFVSQNVTSLNRIHTGFPSSLFHTRVWKAHFHHWIYKSKDFYLTILTFFLIVSVIQTCNYELKKSELHYIKSQLQKKNLKFCLRNTSLYLAILTFFFRIVRYKLAILRTYQSFFPLKTGLTRNCEKKVRIVR